MRFEENEGQFDRRVRYLARSRGMTVRLTDDGAVLTAASHRSGPGGDAITMRVVGARSDAPFVPSDGGTSLAPRRSRRSPASRSSPRKAATRAR